MNRAHSLPADELREERLLDKAAETMIRECRMRDYIIKNPELFDLALVMADDTFWLNLAISQTLTNPLQAGNILKMYAAAVATKMAEMFVEDRLDRNYLI